MPCSASLRGMADEEEDDFTKGLRLVMQAQGQKPAPLSEAAGLGTTAVRDIFRKGGSPKITTAVRLAQALGTTVDAIISAGSGGGLTAELPATVEEPAFVPVYDIVASAGHGAVVESETVLCNMAFDPAFLREMTQAKGADLAIIRVKGHSMEPTLLDDDHVLVDRTKRNLAYDGLFVLRFDDVLHVKRIGRSAKRGNVMVTSDNPAYEKLDMPKEEIDVVGRVLWVGRKV